MSQLGKYLPGSVWPVVMQMEARRSRGANRKTMLPVNRITVLLSVCVGVVLAGLFLPFSVPAALHRFWCALAALQLLPVLAHPRSLPFLLDRSLKALRQAPPDAAMSGSATMTAAGWSALSWVALGTHLALLVAPIGMPSLGLPGRCIGGMGLAVSAGVLFLPAPRRRGPREVVFGFVLVVCCLGAGGCRGHRFPVTFVLADLLMAGLVAFTSSRRSQAGM